MKLNIFSLKYKITFIVFTLEVILLAFILDQTLAFVKKNALNDMQHRQRVITELVKNIATDALFSEEFDDLQQQIDLLSVNEEVDFISVSNLDGIILSHSDFSLVGSEFENIKTHSNHQIKTLLIENLGNINIEFSSTQLEIRSYEARNLGISIAITGVLIIAVASILFGYLLTRKLSSLNMAMQNFQKHNELVDVDIKGRDEVSELAQQFKILTKQVSDHIKTIEDEKILLESRVADRTQALQELNNELEVLASTDYLTNLKNRGFIETALHSELLRFLRNEQHKFSVILLDVDKFKSINDTFGHDAGDLILIDIANLLKNNIRETDIVGRWGGEEFIILCIDTNIKDSQTIAEKLRNKIQQHKFPKLDMLTCSFGVSSSINNDSINLIIKRADLGLYKAKDNGRNCVISITDT